MAAPVVPHGTSGTTSPQGIRAWKWRSTAASLPGMSEAGLKPLLMGGGEEILSQRVFDDAIPHITVTVYRWRLPS
jgi:hypothetical protein